MVLNIFLWASLSSICFLDKLEMFLCGYWRLVGRDQSAAKHPMVHRQSPSTSGNMFSSARLETAPCAVSVNWLWRQLGLRLKHIPSKILYWNAWWWGSGREHILELLECLSFAQMRRVFLSTNGRQQKTLPNRYSSRQERLDKPCKYCFRTVIVKAYAISL